MANEKSEKAYNPFEDVGEDDLDLEGLFSGQSKQSESTEEETKTPSSKPSNVEELLTTLPKETADQLRGAFTNLASQITDLSSKSPSGVSQDQLVALLQGLQNKQAPQQSAEDLEEQNARSEIVSLLKELGLDDDSKTSKFTKAIDVISERRAKRITDPYVRFLGEKFAKEEKSAISRKYPETDGYPSLASSVKEIDAILRKHPTFELDEAYEYVNRDIIREVSSKGVKPEGKKKTSVALTADDVLRKLSLSTDPPSSTTQESVKKTGQAKTIREAMAMAAEQLGLQK